jgi:hypothetical protein
VKRFSSELTKITGVSPLAADADDGTGLEVSPLAADADDGTGLEVSPLAADADDGTGLEVSAVIATEVIEDTEVLIDDDI